MSAGLQPLPQKILPQLQTHRHRKRQHLRTRPRTIKNQPLHLPNRNTKTERVRMHALLSPRRRVLLRSIMHGTALLRLLPVLPRSHRRQETLRDAEMRLQPRPHLPLRPRRLLQHLRTVRQSQNSKTALFRMLGRRPLKQKLVQNILLRMQTHTTQHLLLPTQTQIRKV